MLLKINSRGLLKYLSLSKQKSIKTNKSSNLKEKEDIMPEEETNSIAGILTDINTKINDLDERNNIIKEKITLINQTFLKQNDRSNREFVSVKEELSNLRLEIDRLKEGVQHIISESLNFARKEELKTLEHYAKIFEPLKFVKNEEVRQIIKEELEKR